MTKLACLAIAVVMVGCSKKSEPPAAKDKPPIPDQTAPPPPGPTPPKEIKPEPVDPNACVVTVRVGDMVSFKGGGREGTVKLSNLSFPQFAGTCTANVLPEDSAGYKDVVSVMDALIVAGITDVSLGGGGPKPAATAPSGPSITGEWSTAADGKLTLTGKFDAKQSLKSVPVITLSTTEVTIAGKVVGNPNEGAALAAKISPALPGSPKDPTLIIQADERLTYEPIHAALDAARTAGYTNVLFAVRNKKKK